MGLGGGMAIDAASRWPGSARPLYLAPGIVSVDASVTNAFAVREGGRVEYEGFVVAEAVIVDHDLIRTAPQRLNRAGVGDLLSIHTALWDWRRGPGQGGRVGIPIAPASAAILDRVEALVREIRGDRGGRRRPRRGVRRGERALPAGGAQQPEEGSEHFLAYRLEAVAGTASSTARWWGSGRSSWRRCSATIRTVRAGTGRCGVDWSVRSLGVTREQLVEALAGLPTFVRAGGLTWSIVDEADLSPRRRRAAARRRAGAHRRRRAMTDLSTGARPAAADLAVARSLAPQLLCLPMLAVLTDDEVDRVGLAVRDFCRLGAGAAVLAAGLVERGVWNGE